MVEMELLSLSDINQVDLDSLESFVAKLRDDSSWKDKAYPERLSSMAEWVNKGWKQIVDRSDQLDVEAVGTIDSTSPMIRYATIWARLTRDLAGHVEIYQDAFRPSINHIIKVLWFTSAALRLDHPHFKAFNQCSVQALSNLITLNAKSIDYTWHLLVDCDERQSIVPRLLYTQNKKLFLTTAVLVLNSIHESSEKIQSLIRSSMGQRIMRMLLERLDGLLDDETDVVFEVIVNLVRKVMNAGPISQISDLYYSQATPSQLISPAQLSILKIAERSTVLPSPSFLLTEFQKFSHTLEQTWQAFVLVIEMMVRWIENFHENDQHGDGNIDDDDACKAAQVAIETLKQVSESRNQIDRLKHLEEVKSKQRSMNQILIALVKLLTGLIDFKSRVDSKPASLIQDRIRELDGIPLILSLTLFDVDFPYLREHSIFLIKYLLRNNLKNQELIRNLEPAARV